MVRSLSKWTTGLERQGMTPEAAAVASGAHRFPVSGTDQGIAAEALRRHRTSGGGFGERRQSLGRSVGAKWAQDLRCCGCRRRRRSACRGGQRDRPSDSRDIVGDVDTTQLRDLFELRDLLERRHPPSGTDEALAAELLALLEVLLPVAIDPLTFTASDDLARLDTATAPLLSQLRLDTQRGAGGRRGSLDAKAARPPTSIPT
jgi:hypothetical protein